MSITDSLKELGIYRPGVYSTDGSYIIDLEDSSDDFGRVYSLLDKNSNAEYMQDNSLLTVDNASMYYRYDDIQINIIADFRNNHYKVVANKL